MEPAVITAMDIMQMSYNQLIGLTRETNRPPGGMQTLIRIAQSTFLKPRDLVLEIGTSTGFSAIELARLTDAHVIAIDINPTSLKESAERAVLYGVTDKVTVKQDDATALSFKDDRFDLVFCGNVTSLVSDRVKALNEYCRVLKPGKYLAAVPMYYLDVPSDNLVRRVSKAIQVEITPHYREYWINFFAVKGLERFTVEDYRFDNIPAARVDEFVDKIVARPHLAAIHEDAKHALARQYRQFMHLFRENLSHMGFSIILMRKEMVPMDEELFTASPRV